MKTILCCILLFCSAGSLLAQNESEKPDSAHKPIIYLNAGIDFKIAGISASREHIYKGEYLLESSPAVWEWRERKSLRSDYIDTFNLKVYGFHVSLSPIKALTVGLSYRGVLVKKKWDVPAGFFMITGTAQYDYYFKQAPGLFLSVGGAAGSYQGSDVGIGREFYFSARPGVGFRINDRVTFMANYNQDWMLYRNHPEPFFFERAQTDNTTWRFSYVSLTMEYHFHLIPD